MEKSDQDSQPGFSDVGASQLSVQRTADDPDMPDQTTPLPNPAGLGKPVIDPEETQGPDRPISSAPPALGPESAHPTFSPQEILAKRYRIIRFIGQGGMGEVYEVEDLELRGHFALKTVRPAIAESPGALERFKREIQLARKVTHPNVSRIFDIGHHELPTGGEVTFLTMVLLRGETLADRLRGARPMAESEAFPLISQMAAALNAAHQVGVVHRDFKSANVLLVPPDQEGATVRAVVTDFGLARGIASDDSELSSLSMTGEIMGTAAYMAPEQLKGEPVSAATDIYALGVVIYEMVTGAQPFVGDTPMATAFKRLQEPPRSPRSLAPDLDAQWEATILRCLEQNPLNRFRTATDVVSALTGARELLPAPVAGHQKSWVVAAAFMAIIAILSGAFALYLYLDRQNRKAATESPQAVTHPPVRARRAVAVLDFRNLTGNHEAGWLSQALVQYLTTELSGQALRTVPGENVARMKKELGIQVADSLGKDTLGRIRTNLGTDFVVLGSYTALGSGADSPIRVDVRVQDTLKGDTLVSVAETGTASHLFELVSKVGKSLREKLGAGEIPKAEAGAVQASLPSNPEAARLYSEGLSKLWVFEAVSARDLLQQAVTIEPEHPLTHSALAEAWAALGYDSKAREQAKQAMDLSGGLSKEQRLLVEGSHRQATGEWGKAVETYQSLFILFPDNLDYGLRLVNAQTSAGKGKEGLATVKTLREMPAPTRDDPRIDLAEASVAFSLSDFKGQQSSAGHAIQKGDERSARFVVAEGRKREGEALWKLGQLKKAPAAFEEARQAYAAVGDRRGVADVLNDLAVLFYEQGNFSEAEKRYEVAMDEYREIGYQAGVAKVLNNLALLLWIKKGDLRGARAMYDKALPIFNEIEDQSNAANVLDNNALVIMAQGNLDEAQKMYEQALKVRLEIGDQVGVATSLNNLTDLYYLQGNLESATSAAGEALRISGQISNQGNVAYGHTFLGLIFEAQGNLAAARKEQEHALSIWNQIGEKGSESDSRVALAKLQMEEGRPAEGAALLSSAIEEFQKEEAGDREAGAEALVARCLLAQGKTAEAQQAVSRAVTLSQKSEDVTIRIPIAITDARVRAASGKSNEAIKVLNAASAEAAKAGIATYQFEARAALGEVELQYGNRTRGRELLAILNLEASAKGFGLIAREAAASQKTFAAVTPRNSPPAH